MANHLAQENSPYLLQHVHNPVDWYPWGPTALEKARQQEKPIFLSIGYAACHWCHVMAHESFEDPQTAAFMNDNFVSIKVDREERPDIDSIYMSAVVSMTGQGGWPLSVFLAPDGTPFFGGTYYPPVRRYDMPSFQEVLVSVAHAWQTNRGEILQSGRQISEELRKTARVNFANYSPQVKYIERATQALIQTYDQVNGGWGRAPKFPQPMAIEFLLRRSTRTEPAALETATHVLDAMSRGGMYDVVGGGFARYSTDDNWRVPHFEKMLYDNAQLARVYLHAYLMTKREGFRRVAESTLDFVLRELTDAQGGFYSSLDADSEGQEGKYYVWTLEEIKNTLSEPRDYEFFLAAYEVTPEGNFDGSNVLQRKSDDQTLSKNFAVTDGQVVDWLDHLHKSLLNVRQNRVRPGTDDKILVSWNGLMLAAFAEAARYLKRPDYLAAAVKNARFILTNMNVNDRLLRSWRRGQARQNAYLEDYAALIQGLLALYQSDPDPAWFSAAVTLANQMVRHYKDPQGGFFDTSDDHETLLVKPKEIQDNATPSGNSLAAGALLQLSAYNANGEWRDIAEGMIGQMQELAARYPTAFAGWLQDLGFTIGPVYEVAILGDPDDPATQALCSALWSTHRSNMVAAISAYPPKPGSPALLQDRPLQEGKPTAFVCQQFVCQKPVNKVEELIEQITR